MIDHRPLPVEQVRQELLDALAKGPVVLTAPTGSGKSTQAPRWLAKRGSVLVIEPRRVACRGLAQRVAELEDSRLGGEVGYAVRDDSRFEPSTRILFATPGVVLRWIAGGRMPEFGAMILDEFHERGLDTDLLLALLLDRYDGDLLVMSATLAAERVARHLGGTHVRAEGRVFDVAVSHVPGQTLLPDGRGLEDRVDEALERAAHDPGDVLVFLPGKAEIARLSERLRSNGRDEVLPIHGGLTLEQQSAVFRPGDGRRVILATNVAETSITIPGIGVVIDSGLVRRTRYVNGRGFLTLVPVALDSAEQRTGRAGRTAPGTCYRLWSPDAVLDPVTPPEIHRESLSPLAMAAAACDTRADELPFLDPPKPYSLEAALDDLTALGALTSAGVITDRGRRLFGFPLDAPLGSLLVEAEREGCLEDAIDLVSALAANRPLFQSDRRPDDPADDLREQGCDAVALIRAVRHGDPGRHGLARFALGEARAHRRRLRNAFGLAGKSDRKTVDRQRLIRAALTSDPRVAHVARRRKGRVFWAAGRTEIELAHHSAVDEIKTEAIATLASMAVGQSQRKSRIFATCAMPLELRHLAEAGLGEERVEHAARERGVVVARIERVLAGKVIEKREVVPKGRLAREAIAGMCIDGRLFRQAIDTTRERLAAAALARRLARTGLAQDDLDLGPWDNRESIPELADWITARVDALGVESGKDLVLLSDADFTAEDLPVETRAWLDKEFPRQLKLGDASYEVDYDLKKREATLLRTSGKRKEPPSLSILPTLRGFRIRVQHHSKVWVLRD
ncbi:MAG: ATP-dependent RNA helicase [Deltaproteobacteria bacterium]|nr:ATP-dependent RNA helicase [Deltaproteobacteria bacterium]